MAQVAKIKLNESGDVFIREDLSREYDSISATVANASATAYLVHAAGTPMVVTNPTLPTASAIAATEVQNALTTGFVVNGYVLEPIQVPPGGCKVAIVNRYAGIVMNENAMPLAPPVVGGPAYLLASHIIQMNNLGIVHKAEPPRQDEQLR